MFLLKMHLKYVGLIVRLFCQLLFSRSRMNFQSHHTVTYRCFQGHCLVWLQMQKTTLLTTPKW